MHPAAESEEIAIILRRARFGRQLSEEFRLVRQAVPDDDPAVLVGDQRLEARDAADWRRPAPRSVSRLSVSILPRWRISQMAEIIAAEMTPISDGKSRSTSEEWKTQAVGLRPPQGRGRRRAASAELAMNRRSKDGIRPPARFEGPVSMACFPVCITSRCPRFPNPIRQSPCIQRLEACLDLSADRSRLLSGCKSPRSAKSRSCRRQARSIPIAVRHVSVCLPHERQDIAIRDASELHLRHESSSRKHTPSVNLPGRARPKKKPRSAVKIAASTCCGLSW